MAAATITELVMTMGEAYERPATTAVDSSDGLKIDMLGADHKLLITLENDNAGADVVAKIIGGAGPMAMGDLTVTLSDDQIKVISVESGRYMQSDGTLLIKGFAANGTTGSNKVKVSAVFLP